MDEKLKLTYDKLKEIRTKTDLQVRPSGYLKPTFTGLDGQDRPVSLRDYQIKGVLHLAAMPRFLLGDDCGLGKCKPLDALLLTDRGLLSLGELAPSAPEADHFYPLTRPTKVWTGFESGWQPIRQYYCGGVKKTRQVTTRRGYQTTGSLVHPLWMRQPDGTEAFVQMQDVKAGDYACLYRGEAPFPSEDPVLPIPDSAEFKPGTSTFDVPTRLNPDLARLLGYIVAEGWVNSRYTVAISQHQEYNPEAHADIWQLCATVLGKEPSHGQEAHTLVQMTSVFLRAYLKGLGIEMVLSAGKQVPWPILQGTRDSVVAFLRGYFDGEASVCGSVLEVSSASELMLQQVQVLLLRLGILCTRSKKITKGKPYWRLALCGQDAVDFHNKVGLLTPRKADALEALCLLTRNANLDVVPFARGAVDALRAEILARTTVTGANAGRKGSGIKGFGMALEKGLNGIRNSGRNPTYSFLNRLLDAARAAGAEDTPAYAEVSRLFTNRYAYDPVKTITESEQEVADIEVDHPDHSFVADGFINHNTIQVIAALCYGWVRNPDTKVIVLTNKSAVEQWRDEFTKFTTGIQTFMVMGDKAERGAQYEAFLEASGPSVLVMGYRSAVNDFGVLQEWGGYVLVTDECFSYHTPIKLADGTTELIGKLVSQRQPVEVLSWNPDTGAVESKKIVGWYRKPLIAGTRKTVQKVTFDFADSVLVTGNHEFYTPTGKTAISHLPVGARTLVLSDKVHTEAQEQVVLGSLLGDASLSFPNRPTVGVCFGHATAQRALLDFKWSILAPLGASPVETVQNHAGYPKLDGTPKGYARFRLPGLPKMSRLIKDCGIYRDGHKRVTAEWLSRISPLGLAIWYADDGSVNKSTNLDGGTSYRISLHSSGFSREEQELLVGFLHWRFGVRAQVKGTKSRTDREGGERPCYPYLYLNAKESQKFFDLLPGAIPGVEYKFPPEMPILSPQGFDCTPTSGLVEDTIRSKQPRGLSGREKYVYDIEVEDNHNYFANGSLVSNCTAYKTPSTQVHKVVLWLSKKASKVWGLSATMIKNNLMEGYGIFQVLVPGLFNPNRNKFMVDFCVIKMQMIGRGRQVPIIVGYRKDDIARFREQIDPYFLGRAKHEVSNELPSVTMRDVKVALTAKQLSKYGEAVEGLLNVVKEGAEEERETTKLTALIYCQQIVNDLGLLGYEGEDSPKLDTLVDLLEGDLEGEKVIVFTRFRKMVDIAAPYIKSKGIEYVRITGAEDATARRDAAKRFQDVNSKVRVCFITNAGAEAVNLQAAKAIVFYDSPWSAGDYLQVLGRMIRIGSLHDKVYAIHLITQGTIDGYVAQVLKRKMVLIESVLGKRLKGDEVEADGAVVEQADDGQAVMSNTSDVNELFNTMLQGAKRQKAGK